MVRIWLVFALKICIAAQGVQTMASSNTFFWLSDQGWPSAGRLPTSAATVPKIYNFDTQTTSSLYIWARPEMGMTLKNWSLNLISTNSSILDFTSSTVYGAGVTGVTRWQSVGQPTGNSTSIKNISGFTISSGTGMGIGPATANSDSYYNQATDAWLLARVDYSLKPFVTSDSTDLYLQIGSYGMTNFTGTSADVDVVFGHNGETSLVNAKTKRQMNSSVRDAVINYYPKPDADFDGDTDVDGRDFLIWQRNFGIGNSNATGDATADAVVNAVDLAAWKFQFGMTVFPTLHAAPEPGSLLLVTGIVASLLAICRRKGVRSP